VPVLARARPGFELRINQTEVDTTFEVPLAFLMTPQNYKRESRDWNGLTVNYYVIPFANHNIWGATMTERVRRAAPMSALGQKRTFSTVRRMSALPPKADIGTQPWDVRFVPKADIGLASLDHLVGAF